jgi:hypothetical protein
MKTFAFALGACAAALLAFAVSADAQWSDNFDAYPPNTLLDGQGGWAEWKGSADLTSLVSTDVAASPQNSAKIMLGSHIVQQFAGVTSGQWVLRTLQYIPEESLNTGITFFMIFNNYDNWNTIFNWSITLEADTSNGLMIHAHPGAGNTLPLITNRWAEIRLEIDLDVDWCRVTYDGQFLGIQEWTAGGGAGAQTAIEAIDLLSAQTQADKPVYYDDMALAPATFEIPEPSIFLLAGLGLLALIRRRK